MESAFHLARHQCAGGQIELFAQGGSYGRCRLHNDHFVRQFPNANVIFIEASQGTKDKAEFIKGLDVYKRQA